VYQWYRQSVLAANLIAGVNTASYVTGPLTASQTYIVVVTTSCGTVESDPIVITVVPGTPSNLNAVRSGTSNVLVTWIGSTGATRYRVERRLNGLAFGSIGTPTATSLTDTTCPSGKTCVYRVFALTAENQASTAPSNSDLTTIITLATITPGNQVNFSDIEQIRTLVNAIRAARGSSALTWTSILPAGVSPPAVGAMILGSHITSLRTAMDAALASHGVPTPAYEDPVLTLIRARHLQQLQERSQ
jgi:hypothetical protein